jgi:hypothetical protein
VIALNDSLRFQGTNPPPDRRWRKPYALGQLLRGSAAIGLKFFEDFDIYFVHFL